MAEILLTFVFVFLAALPGRTTFILILLAASTSPWRILIGSIPAFIVQCGLAVVAGYAIRELPHVYTKMAAGLLFLYFARKFWLDSKHAEQEPRTDSKRSRAAIFLLFFMAEMGDVSQLAIAARAAQAESAWKVFIGAAGAMTTIAFLAAFAGQLLGKGLKPAVLQKLAAAFFVLVGVYLLASSFI
jgi:putative Ca2+/H+ antiporter (TMEM165/GDT1 family)